MDTQQVTAPPCAPSPVPGDATPSSGVIHINVRHAAGFTVLGNHLTQHRGLSLTAIGLAAHIQSLPVGAKIGIKVLSERFPESGTRIAAALRELEATGYLHRSRVRLPNGRVVTRTVSYNQPGATTSTAPAPEPRTRRTKPAAPRPTPQPRLRETAPAEAPQAPAPQRTPEPHPTPVLVPAPTAPRTPPPPLPQPRALTPNCTKQPPHSSPTCAAMHLSSSSPRTTSAPSPPASPPGSNATPTPAPSATPSPPTSRAP